MNIQVLSLDKCKRANKIVLETARQVMESESNCSLKRAWLFYYKTTCILWRGMFSGRAVGGGVSLSSIPTPFDCLELMVDKKNFKAEYILSAWWACHVFSIYSFHHIVFPYETVAEVFLKALLVQLCTLLSLTKYLYLLYIL